MRCFHVCLRLGPSASQVAGDKTVADLASHLLTAFKKLSLGVTPTVIPTTESNGEEQVGAGASEAETVPGDICPGSGNAALPSAATPASNDPAPQQKLPVACASSTPPAGTGPQKPPPAGTGPQTTPPVGTGPQATLPASVPADPAQETNSNSNATVQQVAQLTQEDLKTMSEGQILLAWEQGRCPTELINTNNCRNLAMRLRRYCTSQTLSNSPNMEKLFEGSTKDKRHLLQQWLMAGENPQLLEMNLRLDREQEESEGEKWQCLTVEGMKRAGVSEWLGCVRMKLTFVFGFCASLRAKIRAVTTGKASILDKEHPEIMEEARWWVMVEAERKTVQRQRMRLSAEARLQADAATVNALASPMNSKMPVFGTKMMEPSAVEKMLASALDVNNFCG